MEFSKIQFLLIVLVKFVNTDVHSGNAFRFVNNRWIFNSCHANCNLSSNLLENHFVIGSCETFQSGSCKSIVVNYQDEANNPVLEATFRPSEITGNPFLWKIPILEATGGSRSKLFFEIKQFAELQTYCIQFDCLQPKYVKNLTFLPVFISSTCLPLVHDKVDYVRIYHVPLHKMGNEFHFKATRMSSNKKYDEDFIRDAFLNKTSILHIKKYKYDVQKKILAIKFLKTFKGSSRIYFYKKSEKSKQCNIPEKILDVKFINSTEEAMLSVYFENVGSALYCILLQPQCKSSAVCEIFYTKQAIRAEYRESLDVGNNLHSFSEPVIKEIYSDWPFIYTLQRLPARSGLRLIFKLPTFSYKVLQYKIKLMEVGNRNICNSLNGSTIQKITKNFSNEISLSFDDLQPGNYCFRVEPFILDCYECYRIKFTNIFSIKVADAIIPVPNSEKHKKLQDSSHGSTSATYITVSIITMFVILGIFLGIYMFIKRAKRRSGITQEIDHQALSPVIQSRHINHNESNVSVFLVFTEDCDLHLKVIKSFTHLLRSIGCKVHYPMEPECRAYIQLDPVNWFRKLVFREEIDGRIHKIIWVASEMACLRFDGHLIDNHDNPYRLLNDSLDSYYELCSRMIVDRINGRFTENVYSHIAIVTLPYYQCNPYNLAGILPDQRYELPNMLNQLYEFLYDYSVSVPMHFEANLSVASSNKNISNFARSIDNMTFYIKENPDAIYNAWRQRLR